MKRKLHRSRLLGLLLLLLTLLMPQLSAQSLAVRGRVVDSKG